MTRHWHILTAVFRRLFSTPVATLLTVSVMGITLSLPTGLYLMLSSLDQAAGHLGADPQITLFLKVDAGKDARKQIENRLKDHSGIASYRFVGKEQALKELSTSSGLSDLTAGLASNPLPDAYILQPKDSEPATLEQLRDEAVQWTGIAAAELDSNWARRLDAVLGLGKQLTLLVATLLGFGLAAGTGNTIRLQILTRQEEIEVSKLIGATDRFIELPFLYHGALQGLLSGLCAWAIIAASIHFLNAQVSTLAALYGSTFQLQQLGLIDCLTLLSLSALLGWLGAKLAVGHFLRHFRV